MENIYEIMDTGKCQGDNGYMKEFREGLQTKNVVRWNNGKCFVTVCLLGRHKKRWYRDEYFDAFDCDEVAYGRDTNGSTFYKVKRKDCNPIRKTGDLVYNGANK